MMRTYLDCIPCFFKQALEGARIAGANVHQQKRIMNAVARAVVDMPLKASPPEIGRTIYKIVRDIVKVKDPYQLIKTKSNRLAMRMYPRLRKKVAASSDRLLTAVELAIAGNIIDYGVKNSLNVAHELKRIMRDEQKTLRHENRKLFRYRDFRRALKKARTIVYLGDNAGETVFDRILIEEIKRESADKKILYVVKGQPVINDALKKDALDAGLGSVADVISSGIDAPGTVLSLCSPKFRALFRRADMIISKGQGNFEALSEVRRPVFFLFMAKCPVVAAHVGCRIGDIILLYHTGKKKKVKISRGKHC
jgi:uncharacterized protein with ATP-grasp and redox domains